MVTTLLWQPYPHMAALPSYGSPTLIWQPYPHMLALPSYGSSWSATIDASDNGGFYPYFGEAALLDHKPFEAKP